MMGRDGARPSKEMNRKDKNGALGFVLRTRPCVLAIAPSRSELFSGKESTGSGIKFLVTNYDHRPDRGWRFKLSDR